jgi:thioredoxin reductase
MRHDVMVVSGGNAALYAALTGADSWSRLTDYPV